MAISAADLATVRRRTSATEDELSDVVIEAIYDSTLLGNGDLARTTYYVVLELYGLAAVLVDKSSEVDNLSLRHSQKFDHLEKLLTLWGGIAGISVQGITLTVTATHTYRIDSLQTEEPTYARALGDWVTDDV